jgi:hypothetical protein
MKTACAFDPETDLKSMGERTIHATWQHRLFGVGIEPRVSTRGSGFNHIIFSSEGTQVIPT